MLQNQAQNWFLKTALAYLGTPYKWGGDDPSGFDCSGYVLECLKTIGICSENDDFTAEGLFYYFSDKQILETPQTGALLFYLKNNQAYHVVICLDEYFQIGASGGNSQTIEKIKAWNQNAYIKIRPINFKAQTMKIVNPFINL